MHDEASEGQKSKEQRNLKEDTSYGVHVSVYLIRRAEKYRRHMLHRIKWEEDLVKGNDGQEVANSFEVVQVEHYWDLAYSGAVLEASTDQQ
ncbi:hypothetical protein ACLKA7_014736 [Drosophila subpalustris]